MTLFQCCIGRRQLKYNGIEFIVRFRNFQRWRNACPDRHGVDKHGWVWKWCRRFQFFDLEKVDVDIKVKENLKGCQVKCGTSGQGGIILGDSEGSIHYISKQLESRTVAEAHLSGITQMQQLKQSSFLVTLGEDELTSFSIKVWDVSSIGRDSNRTELLLKRTLKLSRPKPATCFIAHENLNFLAVGFSDGYLQIYRGEYTRDSRNLKAKGLILEGGDYGEITGLAFKTMPSAVVLFVSTKNAVFSYDIANKDREVKLQEDKSGCELNCSCYAEGSSEDHFIVGRNDAVYCYTHEGRGPCYGFDGEKHLLYYFRGYLLIIAKLSIESYSVTVFDCANKYVGFSSSLMAPGPIRVAAGEWGSLFLVTSDGTLWQLREKDLQSKMGVFYRKNHYDLAIKVAKSNNFDADGMADIFRQYGDHLYTKGDLDGAIRQYCKTVGKLEASYVVRKYLDASRVLNLLEYLEVVHKTGHATPDLTTLLLNCLTKLKLNEKIELYVKDPSCDFLEPETAIKVFRRGGMSKQAYQLAQKHHLYGSALQILLEDVRDPCKDDLYNILEKTIRDDNAETVLKRFGHALVQLVCQTDQKSNEGWKKIVRLLCESPVKRELVELFIAKKEILVPLLENICLDFQNHDGPLMNLLLEAYLDHWSPNKEMDIATREKMLALLSKAPECPSWDWARSMFACKKFGFSTGEIIAYEKLGLHNDLLSIRYIAALKSPTLWAQFIQTCRKYAKNKPTLWKDAFYLITSRIPPELEELQNNSECPQEIVEEILAKLLEENLMEPLPILDKLCQTKFKLKSVRSFLTKVLDRKEIEEDETHSKKLQAETVAIRSHIENIRTKPSIFQGSRCNACMQKLEFPSAHFLCLHSFHQHCFESYAENDRDCPVCWNKNKDILGPELIETKPSRAALDTEFALKLSTAKSNSFSVLADFFGKGIFKEDRPRELVHKKSVERVRVQPGFESIQGNVSEGRLRLHEGTKPDSFTSDINAPIDSFLESVRHSKPAPIDSFVETVRHAKHSPGGPTFEARQSTLPPIVIGTSLPFPRVSGVITTPAPKPSPFFKSKSPKPVASSGTNLSISAAARKNAQPISAAAKNPFEDEDSKAEVIQPKNPFEEDDEYDPSLNPFET